MTVSDRFEFEKTVAESRGFASWCGTDEAGRGPLAGPVYAAAVYLGDAQISGLDDSKKLSAKKRDLLFDEICEKTVWSIRSVSAREIDETDILSAAQKAMREAVADVAARCGCEGVLVDGNIARGFPLPSVCVVGGDAKCASIAAASILAKVARDRDLVRMEEQYPGYGFAQHKGYGTKAHYAALDELGPCAEHRMTFLKKYFAAKGEKPAPSRGEMGENEALNYFKKKGYKLAEKNFRTRFGEIDLIVTNREYVVFAEVKLRRSADFAAGAEFVDSRKQERVRTAAQEWLQQHDCALQPRFDAVIIYDGEKGKSLEHIENAF